MDCAEALELLSAVDAGAAVPAAAAEALVARGLARRAAAADPGAADEAQRLRAALDELRARRAGVTARVAGATGEDAPAIRAAAREELTRVEAEERSARRELLALAEAPADAPALELTFVGRDLKVELASRPRRAAGASLDAFVVMLEALRTELAAPASVAQALLAELSPSVLLEEHDLRAAVIGLATRPDGARLGPRFGVAVKTLRDRVPDPCLALAAEVVTVTGTSTEGFLALAKKLRPTCSSDEDAFHAAAVAWDAEPAAIEAVVERGVVLAKAWASGPRAPAFLLADAGASEVAVGAVPELERRVLALDPDPVGARWAAAFLAMTPGSFERWREVREWLAKWGPDGVTAAAAMLVQLEGDPPELLDDLRLASAAVRSARLSLHAVENLALGVKLLLQVAQAGDAGVDVSGALARLGPAATTAPLPIHRLPPRFVQAFGTFHAATVHRQVAWRAHHHALHTHAVYG